MTTQRDSLATYQFPKSPAMPLLPLSPERVNASRQSPSQQTENHNPSSPTLKPFGHPELGVPGDFSRFGVSTKSRQEYGSSEESAESEPEVKHVASPVQLAQSMFRHENSSANNLAKRIECSKWSPSKLHSRTSSDVQGMVARFNSLDIKDHVDMRKKDAAALKRAEMGREEAEEEVRKLKEEARAMKKEIDEAKDREKRVVKRLDVLMDDLHRSKETQAHAQTLYEKEIRKARKEAFKASSNMVKLQEDIKVARKALGVVQSDLDLERIKLSRKEEDAFSAQYQLVGVQEQLTQAQSQIKIVEEERDALKTSLKEEEISRIAAEGCIALPPAQPDDEEFGSPAKKQQAAAPSLTKEFTFPLTPDVEQLKTELDLEIQRRKEAEEQIDFMKMECQFGCCSCKLADRQQSSYLYDTSLALQIQKFKESIAAVLTPPESVVPDMEPDMPYVEQQVKDAPHTPESFNVHHTEQAANAEMDNFNSMQPVPVRPQNSVSPAIHSMQMEDTIVANVEPNETCAPHDTASYSRVHQDHMIEAQSEHYTLQVTPPQSRRHIGSATPAEAAIPLPMSSSKESDDLEQQLQQEDGEEERMTRGDLQDQWQESYDPAEYDGTWKTVTTTTKVPLIDEASTPDYRSFFSPMTLTREEAIEQLRIRRGRARSAAGTPRKPLASESSARRDISAPEAKSRGTPRAASREKPRR